MHAKKNLSRCCLSSAKKCDDDIHSFIQTTKGPFIFYEVGGAGGIWGGVTEKKTALKGEPSKKIREKGGQVKYFSSALRWGTCYYS